MISLDINPRIIITMDPEQESYAVEFEGGVNVGDFYKVLKHLVESIDTGTLFTEEGLDFKSPDDDPGSNLD